MKSWDEYGFIAGAEGLYFGVLIFVFGILIVLNAWFVVDTKFAMAGVAREAARAYAEANDSAVAEDAAQQAGEQSMASHGRDASLLQISINADGYYRCAPFSVTAKYPVRLSFVPFFGGRTAYTVSSSYNETVDAFRTGLTGEIQCE